MKTKRLSYKLILLLTIHLALFHAGMAWGETQTILLSPGWNFISFQIEPEDPNIEIVFSGLDVSAVWYYDALLAMNGLKPWQCYRPDNPSFLNGLYEVHARRGYWVEMRSSDVLVVDGQIPSGSITSYPGAGGENGWNAIGFFSPDRSYKVKEVFVQSVQGLYEGVWGFDSGNNSFVELGPESLLEPGKAYWVECIKGFEIQPDIEANPTVLNLGSKAENGLIQIRNRVSTSSNWMATASTDDGGNWLGLKAYLDDDQDPAAQLSGSVSLYYKPIYVVVDRGGMAPGEYTGRIRLITTGKPSFPVDIEVTMSVEPVQGDYSGTLVIRTVNGKEINMISTGIVASVTLEGSDVVAVLDPKKSLLFPKKLILSGGLINTHTSSFSVSGTLSFSRTDPLNPYRDMGKEIHRQIYLETTSTESGNNILGGVYRETISDFIGQTIEAEGVFQLHKVNDIPTDSGSTLFGALQGTVVNDATSAPVGNATVVLTGMGLTESISSLGDGTFQFDVPESLYHLSVQASGYQTASQVVSFNPVQPETITLRLIPANPGTIITASDSVDHSPPLGIPDATSIDTPGSPVQSTITLSQEGFLESLSACVNITHNDVSELLVTLISPQGTPWVLHNRGAGHNLDTCFDASAAFLGENPQGDWVLRIVDHEPGNTGTLNSFTISTGVTPPELSAATFSGSPAMGLGPLSVQFSALSPSAASWQWDFGDPFNQAPGTGKTPTHVYLQPGIYTVSLTAVGPEGSATVTKPAYVQVWTSAPAGGGARFRWAAFTQQTSTNADTASIVAGSGRAMAVMVGSPAIGGIQNDGKYGCIARRADKMLWAGALPVRP